MSSNPTQPDPATGPDKVQFTSQRSRAPACVVPNAWVYASDLFDWESTAADFSIVASAYLDRAYRPDPFESFIFLWVFFNAWTARLVKEHPFVDVTQDAYQVGAARLDERLKNRFQDLLQDDPDFRRQAEEFRNLWPIFEIRKLEDLKDEHGQPIGFWREVWPDEGRKSYVSKVMGVAHAQYGQELPKRFLAPACYTTHDPRPFPLDWNHALAAIYQVRCNLFHGGKNFRNEGQVLIVQMARDILLKVWAEFVFADEVSRVKRRLRDLGAN